MPLHVQKKRWNRLAWSGLLLLPLAAGVSFTDAISVDGADDPPVVGLQGIIPGMVPFGLLEDDFADLGETWQDWSVEASAEVARLYEETQDVASQRETLAQLKKRLKTMEKALGDRAYRSIFDQLATQHGRLSRRVDVAEAVLDTLELDPAEVRAARVDQARDEVLAAVQDLDRYLSGVNKGNAWLGYVKATDVKQMADGNVELELLSTVRTRLSDPDQMQNDAQRQFIQKTQFVALRDRIDNLLAVAGESAPATNPADLRAALAELATALERFEETGDSATATAVRTAFQKVRDTAPDQGNRMADALSSHYFNYNMRVIASEHFLNRIAGYTHVDNGAVDDFILGAKVDGQQSTNATVSVDLMPSNDTVKFAMTLSGATQSNTQGVTDQATIFTQGYHTFRAAKTISFDGDKFHVAPATINVNANNTTVGARTGASGIPLIGSIADSYAVGEAQKRRSQSEAIARQRVSSRVLPEFDAEVGKAFSDLNSKMSETVLPKLHENRLFPSARSYRSDNDQLWINTRLMEAGEVGGDSPVLTAVSSRGLALHLHETVINNALSRLPLAGRALTEDELAQEITASLSQLLGREIKAPEKKEGETPDPTKFLFPASDCIRVNVVSGELVLILRMGLQPEGDEAIPTQEISVPLSFAIEGTDIVVSAGDVGVAPVDPPESTLVQIARAGIVRTKIQKALPTRRADRMIDVQRDNGGPVQVAITQIKANAGWLSVVIE